MLRPAAWLIAGDQAGLMLHVHDPDILSHPAGELVLPLHPAGCGTASDHAETPGLPLALHSGRSDAGAGPSERDCDGANHCQSKAWENKFRPLRAALTPGPEISGRSQTAPAWRQSLLRLQTNRGRGLFCGTLPGWGDRPAQGQSCAGARLSIGAPGPEPQSAAVRPCHPGLDGRVA